MLQCLQFTRFGKLSTCVETLAAKGASIVAQDQRVTANRRTRFPPESDSSVECSKWPVSTATTTWAQTKAGCKEATNDLCRGIAPKDGTLYHTSDRFGQADDNFQSAPRRPSSAESQPICSAMGKMATDMFTLSICQITYLDTGCIGCMRIS